MGEEIDTLRNKLLSKKEPVLANLGYFQPIQRAGPEDKDKIIVEQPFTKVTGMWLVDLTTFPAEARNRDGVI